MKKLLLALALCLAPLSAFAQCNGVFNPNTICGNATGVPAIPGMVPTSVLTGIPGGANGQIQYNNSGAFGGFTPGGDLSFTVPNFTIVPNAVTNAKINPGAANTVKGSLNGTTLTDLGIPSCTGTQALQYTSGVGFSCASVTTTIPVFSTRTVAAATNLSAFTTVKTLGWSVGGDGGEATFRNVGAAPFVDSFISSVTISGNGTSGCTNGSYLGVLPTGGTGTLSTFGLTVAGNVVTAAQIGAPGNAYSVGDVLTTTIAGCSTAVTLTVATITTPSGSFTDTSGAHFQIVYPAAGLDARSMGVKFDCDVGCNSGSATDNFVTLQNSFNFAAAATKTIVDLGGSIGGQVLLAKQTAMFCGSGTVPLRAPNGVKVKGQGNYTSVLRVCDTWNPATNVFELCDPTSHLACFGAMLEDFQIFSTFNVLSTGTATMVYTNNGQHESGLRNMVLYPGACRRAVWFETGYGGATYIELVNVEIKGGLTPANCAGVDNPAVLLNYGSTQVFVTNLVPSGISPGSGGNRNLGLFILGGFVDINGFHSENIVTPIHIQIAGGLAAGQVRLRNGIGGVGCGQLVNLAATNTPGNFIMSPPMAQNGCPILVNGVPQGSTNLGAAVATDTVFPNPALRSW